MVPSSESSTILAGYFGGDVGTFVFVVRIGDDVYVCGREQAVFVLLVGIKLSSAMGLCLWFVYMVEICCGFGLKL